MRQGDSNSNCPNLLMSHASARLLCRVDQSAASFCNINQINLSTKIHLKISRLIALVLTGQIGKLMIIENI